MTTASRMLCPGCQVIGPHTLTTYPGGEMVMVTECRTCGGRQESIIGSRERVDVQFGASEVAGWEGN